MSDPPIYVATTFASGSALESNNETYFLFPFSTVSDGSVNVLDVASTSATSDSSMVRGVFVSNAQSLTAVPIDSVHFIAPSTSTSTSTGIPIVNIQNIAFSVAEDVSTRSTTIRFEATEQTNEEQEDEDYYSPNCLDELVDRSETSSTCETEDPATFRSWVCGICGYHTETPELFERHEKEWNGARHYRCDICEVIFERIEDLLAHEKQCRVSKQYKCHCGESFNREINYTVHAATHDLSGAKELRCPVCQDVFRRVASFRCHLKLHTVDDMVTCILCHEEFSGANELRQHMRSEHAPPSAPPVNICKQCGAVFKRPLELAEHMITHKKIKETLKTSYRRKNNAKSKKTIGKYTCDACSKTFDKKSTYDRHKLIHTGERPFACKVCDQSFNQKGALMFHEAKHLPDKPHKCQLCGAGFSQRGNLRTHVKRVHPANVIDSQSMVKCPLCSCQFQSMIGLKGHVSKRHNELIYLDTEELYVRQDRDDTIGSQSSVLPSTQPESSATALRKRPARESNVAAGSTSSNRHKRLRDRSQQESGNDPVEIPAGVRMTSSSNGARSWQCVQCEKSLSKLSDAIRHIRTHTGERPYQCQICPKRFTLRSTLDKHVRGRAHLGLKTTRCYICWKELSNAFTLAIHLRTHSRLTIDCDQCARKFRTKSDLTRHKKRLHPGTSAIAIDSSSTAIELRQPLMETAMGTIVEVAEKAAANEHRTIPFVGHDGNLLRPYACGRCPLRFKKRSHLDEHNLRAHEKSRQYFCRIGSCQHRFTTVSGLREHAVIHLGVRKHRCAECNKSFATKRTLSRHMFVHSDRRPFICPYCGKRFKRGVLCRQHIKTHKRDVQRRMAEDQNGGEIETGFIGTTENQANWSIDAGMNAGDTMQNSLWPNLHHAPDVYSNYVQPADEERSTMMVQPSNQNQPSTTNQPSSSDVHSTAGLGGYSGSIDANLSIDDARPLLSAWDSQNMSSSMESIDGGVLAPPNLRSIDHHLQLQPLVHTLPNASLPPQPPPTLVESVLRTPDMIGLNPSTASFPSSSFHQHSTSLLICELCSAPFNDEMQLDAHSRTMHGQQRDVHDFDMTTIQHQPYNSTNDGGYYQPVAHGHQIYHHHDQMAIVSEHDHHLQQQQQQQLSIDQGRMQHRDPIDQLRTHPESMMSQQQQPPHHDTIDNPDVSNFSVDQQQRPMRNWKSDQFTCPTCGERFRKAVHLTRHVFHAHSSALQPPSSDNPPFQTNAGVSLTLAAAAAHATPDYSSLMGDMADQLIGHGMGFEQQQHLQLNQSMDEHQRAVLNMTGQIPVAQINNSDQSWMTPSSGGYLAPAATSVARRSNANENLRICPICEKPFKKPSDLIRHIRTHTDERPFVCDCGRGFKVKSALASHQQTHENNIMFRCQVCNKILTSRGALKVHLRQHTAAKLIQCPQCVVQFRTVALLKQHLIRTHSLDASQANIVARQQQEQHQAPPIDNRHPLNAGETSAFVRVATRNDDQGVLSDDDRLGLTFMYNTENELQLNVRHIPAVEVDQPQVGNVIVEVRFLRELAAQGMTLTIPIQEGANETTISLNPEGLLEQGAQQASASSSSSAQLLNQSISDQSIINCGSADRIPELPTPSAFLNPFPNGDDSFDQQQQPSTSTTAMIAEKPIRTMHIADQATTTSFIVECIVCDLKFANMDESRIHFQSMDHEAAVCMQQETNGPSFLCEICGKLFPTHIRLARHLRSHTGERPFQCNICGECFNQPNALKKHHTSRHTQERPFACPLCERRFSFKYNMETHMRRIHGPQHQQQQPAAGNAQEMVVIAVDTPEHNSNQRSRTYLLSL